MKTENEELSEGVWIEEIDNAALKQFEKNQNAFQRGFVNIMPYKSIFPKSFLSYEKPIRDFEVRDDDIYVVSFPKCGTTWTQEMVWNICNGCDIEKAKSIPWSRGPPSSKLAGSSRTISSLACPRRLRKPCLRRLTLSTMPATCLEMNPGFSKLICLMTCSQNKSERRNQRLSMSPGTLEMLWCLSTTTGKR